MSEDKLKPIHDHAISNARNNLNLVRMQVKSRQIETDFALRQLDNLDALLVRLEAAQKVQMTASRFEALYNVSRVLGSSLDLQTVLNQVMDAIIQLTSAERGFLMLRDDDGGLIVKAARNLDQQTISSEEFNYSRTIANQVLDSGEAVLTTNAAEDPRYSGQSSIVNQSLRSIMATPLRARGQVIGVAYVDSRVSAELFKNDDLTTFEALTAQAAVAIDNAMLFRTTDQELARKVEELQLLRRIDQQLNETLDTDNAIAITLESACRLVSADAGHLGIIDTERRHVAARHHYGSQEQSSGEVWLEEIYPEVWQVLETKQKLVIDIGQYGLQTALIMPVLRNQQAVGAVVLKRQSAEPFTEEQQDLTERVIARAAVAIENARLYQAVQRANQAKSEFVSVAAHELKTPMTSIAGYAELMTMNTEQDLSERHGEFASRILATVRRMEMLVSELSDISRIESGHFFMNEMPLPVESIIVALKDTTMPEIQGRGHTLIEEVEANLPDIYADYYRLLQVLMNLVSNAYKYTPEGGTILIGAWREKDRVFFRVADNGIGLSPEAIKNLGTKFWRAEDEFTRSQPGTGLGFAITSGLVEQMGSRIQIESELGKGSSFSFSVAIAKEE